MPPKITYLSLFLAFTGVLPAEEPLIFDAPLNVEEMRAPQKESLPHDNLENSILADIPSSNEAVLGMNELTPPTEDVPSDGQSLDPVLPSSEIAAATPAQKSMAVIESQMSDEDIEDSPAGDLKAPSQQDNVAATMDGNPQPPQVPYERQVEKQKPYRYDGDDHDHDHYYDGDEDNENENDDYDNYNDYDNEDSDY